MQKTRPTPWVPRQDAPAVTQQIDRDQTQSVAQFPLRRCRFAGAHRFAGAIQIAGSRCFAGAIQIAGSKVYPVAWIPGPDTDLEQPAPPDDPQGSRNGWHLTMGSTSRWHLTRRSATGRSTPSGPPPQGFRLQRAGVHRPHQLRGPRMLNYPGGDELFQVGRMNLLRASLAVALKRNRPRRRDQGARQGAP
jgi:hypothetical protein